MRNLKLTAAIVWTLGITACAGALAKPPVPPTAEQVGVPQLGRQYAEFNCASCHAIDAGKKLSPNPNAPAFQTVADTPGMTYIAIRAWLHTSHPTMPNLIVDSDRMDDLAAYIATLRKPHH